jgi:hypothetical protein
MRSGGDESAADGIGGAGNHHGGLPGSSSGEDLDPVVEAHNRSCLLIVERGLLDDVEERPPRREVTRHDLFVDVGDNRIQVRVQEADRLKLIGGEERPEPGRMYTIGKSRFGTDRDQRVNGLNRDPPLLDARPGENLSDGGVPCDRVSDCRCQSETAQRP